MPRLDLGNPAPRELHADADTGEQAWREFAADGSVTTVDIPDGYPLLEVVSSVTLPGGVWERHSGASAPSWVASDVPMLAELLAQHYGCPVEVLS